MEALTELEQSLVQLIDAYTQLRLDLEQQKAINAQQREEIIRTHAEFDQLDKKYRQLQAASAMIGTQQERDAAKQRLSQIIRQVDTALEVLKQ